jgi:hypothetical protein
MAFDPGYSNPASPGYGLFYAYFVRPPTGGESNGPIRIEEFSADPATNPNVATSSTARLVLEIPHNDANNHYGGTLQFRPSDGLLYIATGDGGGGDNQYQNAQDTKKSLLGKLLRIDPHATMSAPYSIPAGNPFSGNPLCNGALPSATDCPEILAWGLRNPFRWSFDTDTSDLTVGDVGQSAYEEIDYVPVGSTLAGVNFGWPCNEGPLVGHIASSDPRCNSTGPFLDPVDWYAHSGSTAITGGVVVRDASLGPLVGRYLYADFYKGVVHSELLATPRASDDRTESDLPVITNLVSFGQDADKHVYIVSLSGTVQRIVCSGTCEPSGGGTTTPPPVTTPPAGETPLPVDQPLVPPLVRDLTAPVLRVRAARRQDVLHRGVVRFSVACDENCIVRASGLARGLKLRSVLKRLAAGERVVFELRASKRVRAALGRRGSVTLHLRGRDAAGNLRTASLVVRVKRSR